eukprot:Pgem_evm1s8483
MQLVFGIYRIRALIDTGAEVSVIDSATVRKMKGMKVDYTPIELKLADEGVAAHAEGQLTHDVMLSIGRNRYTKSKPIVMNLDNEQFEMILSYEDMEALGMTISGLPNPTDLDNDSALQDEELFSDPKYDMDTQDYANVKQACLDELVS